MNDFSLTRRSLFGCACCGAMVRPRVAIAVPGQDRGYPEALELGTTSMSRIAPTVWVGRIAEGLFLYTTTALIDGGIYYPANGLILERDEDAVLIDTTYGPEQAKTLLAWCARHARPISLAIATHFHNDRTGGIPALRDAGIRTWAHPLTCELARRRGLPVPEPIDAFSGDHHDMGPYLQLYAPGPAHTRDNIVAWLPRQQNLFGGCMIKSTNSPSLGNVADAVLRDWPASVRRVRARYHAAKCVVPGHGAIAGDPIATTLSLLAKA
jgi:glyoxylase-like metal-dependent hydrolase (beta-lactamase superfamily II)